MVNLIGGGSSLETVVSDMNKNLLEIKGSETTQIFKDETGTRRVLLGKGADGFYGLKVSQPNFDVFTAEDDELIFNSGQNVFKIVKVGTFTMSKDASDNYNVTDADVDPSLYHNLGFAPGIVAFWYFDPYYFPDPFFQVNRTSGALDLHLRASVDDTRVIGEIVAPTDGTDYAGAASYTCKYYLLQETASA